MQSRLAARLRAMPDVATVATGAHDLPDRVAAGTFDRDLYAQLAKAVVEMPPLAAGVGSHDAVTTVKLGAVQARLRAALGKAG